MGSQAETLLKSYREKRDFETTAEPSGQKAVRKHTAGESAGLAFCVQKHDATRLHYDFRIEWEGVLKSWAVTRGPSIDPADKRLAVRTEDHPLDYGDFEGTIPKGQYGGGTVMLWDRGTWEPLEDTDPEAGLRDGNLKMQILGEKMTGRWALIRMKPRAKERTENWLLIKEKDEIADPESDILARDRSVKTGRDMAAIARGEDVWETTEAPVEPRPPAAAGDKPKSKRARATKATKPVAAASALAPPAFRPVQLATLVDAAPEGAGWLHEMKYDGYRVLIAIGGGAARLYTRNALDWTDRFGALLPAASALSCRSALIDGEVVAFDTAGKTDFSSLQARLNDGGDLSCFCFDLLELDGADLTGEPLTTRKAKLQKLLGTHDQPTLLYSEHVAGKGPAVFRQICASGHEGIIAKRADAPYRAGRGKTWLKIKCTRRQEFVIGGFSVSDKKGRAFSSILVGVHEDGALDYRGRVGSGFDDAMLDDLKSRFAAIAQKDSPFADLPKDVRRTARFVAPTLVAEIDFTEITADGHIRHGVFKGMREDKMPEEIADERPADAADLAAVGSWRTKRAAIAKASVAPPPPKATVYRASKADTTGALVAGVKLTHPERVVFESQGVTKLDLAQYYEAVASRMLVHAGGRPLSLVRCPQGRQRHCFFQKHDSGGFPEAIRKVAITEKDGDTAEYLYVADAAGLVAAVQMNTLEFHIWGSSVDDVDKPDRVVFDFDPDESLIFADVKTAAAELRARLSRLGLESFAMVTGGKGVHVVAPLARRQGWDEVKGFASDLAHRMAAGEPDRFIATMSKAKRRGKIFVDWLRNERGSTAVAPYSTRSREGAPVAVPVAWEELASLDAANGFHPADVLARLDRPDPWAGYGDVRQSLTKALLKKLAAL